MDVQLRCAEDISIQVHIPTRITVEEFLEKVSRLEQVIARNKPTSASRKAAPASEPLPRFEESQAPVDDRLANLEQSTQQIMDLLDGLSR